MIVFAVPVLIAFASQITVHVHNVIAVMTSHANALPLVLSVYILHLEVDLVNAEGQ